MKSVKLEWCLGAMNKGRDLLTEAVKHYSDFPKVYVHSLQHVQSSLVHPHSATCTVQWSFSGVYTVVCYKHTTCNMYNLVLYTHPATCTVALLHVQTQNKAESSDYIKSLGSTDSTIFI